MTSASTLIDDVQKIFEGKTEPPPGTFFIFTAQEYVQYQTKIRFKLSKRRVERMRAEKWSMVVYRNDTGEQGEYGCRLRSSGFARRTHAADD